MKDNRQDNNAHPISPPLPNDGNGGGGWWLDVDRRVTRIETELRHVATKAWVLGGVVGGMALAAMIALAVARYLAA